MAVLGSSWLNYLRSGIESCSVSADSEIILENSETSAMFLAVESGGSCFCSSGSFHASKPSSALTL